MTPKIDFGFASLTHAERAVIATVEPMIVGMVEVAVTLTNAAGHAKTQRDQVTAARVVLLLAKLSSIQALLDDVLDAAHREGYYEDLT